MIDEVRGNSYFNEPIAFEMDDGDIREMIRPYIMGRIVDVEEFLHLYHCSPEEKGVCFDLDIDDAFPAVEQPPVPRLVRGVGTAR